MGKRTIGRTALGGILFSIGTLALGCEVVAGLEDDHRDLAGQGADGGPGSGSAGSSGLPDAGQGSSGGAGTSVTVDGASTNDVVVAGDGPAIVAPPGCDGTKTPLDDNCVVDDGLGVFVSPIGADTNPGTKLLPFKTIGKGLASSMGKRVYVCSSGGEYAENVLANGAANGVALFGGLDCTKWQYTGIKATVRGTTAGPVFTVKGATNFSAYDLEIFAPNATAASGSSIAILVAVSTANFVRSKVHAGDGAAGAPAPAPANNYDPAMTPTDPIVRGLFGSGATPAATKTCLTVCMATANNVHSTGGKGGVPGDGTAGTNGAAGTPDYGAPPPNNGAGGLEFTVADGHTGANAPAVGGGAGATTFGQLTADGWAPADGQPGTLGGPGQGGGGGAGDYSNGGNGGACGGCPGSFGAGGKAGGSSFAVLSFNSQVTIDGCDLYAGKPGKGSSGAAGQIGQAGGAGTGSSQVHGGGNGGKGADGGGGGGGAAGLSVAVGYAGTKPNVPANSTLNIDPTPATGGAAGARGTPVATAGKQLLVGQVTPTMAL